MTNWLKYAAVTMLVFVVFAAGYQLASARGDAALKSYPENRGIYTQSDSSKKSSRNIWSLAVVSVDQRY